MPSRIKKRYIPLEIVTPIVCDIVDNWEMGPSLRPSGKRPGSVQVPGTRVKSQPYSAKVVLAEECGLRAHVIYDICRGKFNSKQKGHGLKLATVDKILTATDRTHLWFEEPLSEYYNENTF